MTELRSLETTSAYQPANSAPCKTRSLDLQPIALRSQTRLTGRWLFAARLGWLVVSAPTLALAAIGFVAAVQDPTRVGPPAITRILLGAGLPLTAGLFGLLTPVFLVFTITALVLIWNTSDDAMVLLFALAMLLTGACGSRFVFTAQTVLPVLHTPIMLLAGTWTIMLVLALYLFPDGRFEPRGLG